MGMPVDSYQAYHSNPPHLRVAAGPLPYTPLHPPAALPLAPELENARHINPPMLCCPLTGQLMLEPVLADDGYTYEREVIQNYLLTGLQLSPATEQPLADTQLVPNHNLKMAIEALMRWREAGATGDVRIWLRPAIIDPGGTHNPMRQPMTLSDGTTSDAANLPALFQQHPVYSPFTRQLWTRNYETARYNRALQALAAAILEISPPAYTSRRQYPTWREPTLSLPPPSSRRAYSTFCCGYPGMTASYQPLAVCAAIAVGFPLTIASSLSVGASIGVGASTYLGCIGTLRAIDYPAYRLANQEAVALYEDKHAAAYDRYNAQRLAIGLPPVPQAMQR
jgi:hypothetical protein